MTRWREFFLLSQGEDRSWDNKYFREELFYQLGLRQFGDFSRIKLEPSPSLRSMIEMAINADETTENSRLSKNQLVEVRHSVAPLEQTD
jgi:DNA mismatch repair protein Mlh1 C-terminus